jgi:hypothetical protein
MPYKHAAEISDLWKQLPLCDILRIENPRRYFETNSVSAVYEPKNKPELNYGVLHALKNNNKVLNRKLYFGILKLIGFRTSHVYFGSPHLP